MHVVLVPAWPALCYGRAARGVALAGRKVGSVDLAERVAHVRLLLITLNDPYPTPRGILTPDSGPAASRYVPCVTCHRRGEVRVRRGWVLCLICDGYGWKRRVQGEPEWDAYVELPVEEAVTMPVMPSAPSPQAQAAARRAAEEERRGQYRLLAFGWERAIQAHDRHGSYRELRRRLDWLRERRPRRYSLIRSVLVDHEPRRVSVQDTLEIDLGVLALALRMRTVRVPPWIIERSAAADRRETVAALATEGYSAGEIARRLGIPKETVRRRLKRLPTKLVESKSAGVPARAT